MTWRDYLCLGIVGGLLLSTRWFTVNISRSVPLGLYRWGGDEVFVQRGDLVRVPAVRFGRAWIWRRIPLLKPVAAMQGDMVCLWTVRDDGGQTHLFVLAWNAEAQDYGRVYRESNGQALPTIADGCHEIGAGEVFVASRHDKSLDSRYFGPVRVNKTRVAVPVWIWGE